MANHGYHQSAWGLRGNADMYAAEAADDVGLVIIMCIHLRKIGNRLDDCLHEKWQQGELRAAANLTIQGCTETFQCRDIDLFNVREVGNAPRRLCHLLGDATSETDNLDFFNGRVRQFGLGCRHMATAQKEIEIFMPNTDGPTAAP